MYYVQVTLLTDTTYGNAIFENNCFPKTLLFCANFSRKTTKIRISDQLLYFVILRTTFQSCVNALHTSSRLTTSTSVPTEFENNNFTKTLLFCANFLRKMTKISISDQLP
jgi:hypothetical protein